MLNLSSILKVFFFKNKLIFIFLIGCYTTIYAQSDWINYIVKKEKGMMSISIDMDLNNNKPNYKNLVIVGTHYKSCLKNGFPKEDGLEKLYAFSDSIRPIIDYTTKNKLAGIITYQCMGFDVFYVQDTTDLRKNIDKMLTVNFKQSKNYIIIKKDKKWLYYYDSLYPEFISDDFFINQQFLSDLVFQGDDLSGKRKINHWIYFKNEKRRLKFIKNIKKLDFVIDSINYKKEKKYAYEIQISRKDFVDPKTISELTRLLKIFINSSYGEYDGWRTELVIQD